MDEFYEAAAERLAVHLAAGRTVALLAAGDPLFYSSYMHMHKRLADRFDAEVIPGVTSVSAASAALGKPLVEGEEILTILPGTLPQAELTRRLKETDAAAILKLGRTFPPVLQSLEDSGRLGEAHYVERASTTRQRVESAAEVDPDGVPYFSIAIVPSPSNNPRPAAESRGEVVVVGLGPGDTAWTTPEVRMSFRWQPTSSATARTSIACRRVRASVAIPATTASKRNAPRWRWTWRRTAPV